MLCWWSSVRFGSVVSRWCCGELDQVGNSGGVGSDAVFPNRSDSADAADVAEAEVSKKILSLDFDGVCHSYTSPWQGAAIIPDPPVLGMWEFLLEATKHFRIQVYSTRSETAEGRGAMRAWFAREAMHRAQGFTTDAEHAELLALVESLEFPASKPKAFVGLDDRVLTFEGMWPQLDTLLNFKPWNKRGNPS